jgi:hypothetical protein
MPDDVRVMSVAFHPPCELTRISHPSETLAGPCHRAIPGARAIQRRALSYEAGRQRGRSSKQVLRLTPKVSDHQCIA